jgi:drug/metabolite transporter (DMT)-like permease
VYFALGAALLFGFSTPLTKPLLGAASPWLTAGLLYLGAGLGAGTLWLLQRWTHSAPVEVPLSRKDMPWLAGAIATGGVLAPVLLMFGLRETPATSASLLLNLEGVFTLLLAWVVFRENVDLRVGVGAAAILLGAATASWQGLGGFPAGAALIAGACLLWAVDNSLSRQVSGADPLQITSIKGWVAGVTNTGLALWQGAHVPPALPILATLAVGALGYGVSLALYVAAMRHLGSARTAAYFSLAPFFGAMLGVVVLGDAVTAQLLAAGGLMGVGLYLHLSERHEHPHTHAELRHEHAHWHDLHHQHVHTAQDPPGESHSHEHLHPPIAHRHPHYPDIHHRHSH